MNLRSFFNLPYASDAELITRTERFLESQFDSYWDTVSPRTAEFFDSLGDRERSKLAEDEFARGHEQGYDEGYEEGRADGLHQDDRDVLIQLCKKYNCDPWKLNQAIEDALDEAYEQGLADRSPARKEFGQCLT